MYEKNVVLISCSNKCDNSVSLESFNFQNEAEVEEFHQEIGFETVQEIPGRLH